MNFATERLPRVQVGYAVIELPARPDAWGPGNARALTTTLLSELPDRLAHSLRAGVQASRLAARGAVPEDDADLLVAAALLHDIGYAPTLRDVGFHALDGAAFLCSIGAPPRLAALVAHHSESRLLAEAAGLAPALSRYPYEGGPVTDALAYADMTSGPGGAEIGIVERLADIAIRHADDDPHSLAARQARVPRLLAAAERVRLRTRLRSPAG